MNCKNCGKKLKKGDAFCSSCGSKVEPEEQEIKNEQQEENKDIKQENIDNITETKEEVKTENVQQDSKDTNQEVKVEQIKMPTGLLVASIIATVLSLISINIIATVLGIIAIVYLTTYKEAKTQELMERNIKNAKTFNIIAWVVYGIGMLIRIFITILIIIPIVIYGVSDRHNDDDWFEDTPYENVDYDDNDNDVEDTYSYLTEIEYDYAMELYNKDSKSIIVLVQTYCGYCNMYKPIINEIARENNIDIYLLDVYKMDDTVYNKLLNSIDYFKENDNWGTPTTLIVGNGSTIDYLEGYTDYQTTIDFYKKNSLLNK